MLRVFRSAYAINLAVARGNSDSHGNPDNAIGASAASAAPGDVFLWAVINACVFIVFIAAMTFLLVLLFKFRCYKVSRTLSIFMAWRFLLPTNLTNLVCGQRQLTGVVRPDVLHHLHRAINDQWHVAIPNIDFVGSTRGRRHIGIRVNQFQRCRGHRHPLWQGGLT